MVVVKISIYRHALYKAHSINKNYLSIKYSLFFNVKFYTTYKTHSINLKNQISFSLSYYFFFY